MRVAQQERSAAETDEHREAKLEKLIKRDWQLRLLKRGSPGNSTTEGALFKQNVEVSRSDCITEFPTVHHLW